MSNDTGIFEQRRRQFILRFLFDMEKSANDTVIVVAVLRSQDFYHSSRDMVRADLDFLAQRRLTTDEWFGDIRLVRLTERGEDVAFGRLAVDGIVAEHWYRS